MLEGFRGLRYLIVLIVSAFNTLNAQSTLSDTATVAFVNNEPVILREFKQRADKERTQVIRFFRINYGCEYNDDFWNKIFDGKTPADVLKKKTLDTLVQIKVQQIEAKKWGIIRDIGYQEFLKRLVSENKRRAEARSNNKVIYGPVQYSEDVFYNYLFSNMVNQLKNTLDENVFKITDETLQKSYEADKNRLYRRGYYTEVHLIQMHFKQGAGIKENIDLRNDAREKLILIGDCLSKEDSCIQNLEENYRNNPVIILSFKDVIYNDSVYSTEEDHEALALVKETASKMKKGEVSPVIELPDDLYIFTIKEKKLLGYRSFEESRRNLKASMLDKLYLQYINDLFLHAHIELNSNVYNQISF